MALNICRSPILFTYFKKMKELPLALIEDFDVFYTEEDIFEFFIDRISLYFEVRKIFLEKKLLPKILNQFEKIENKKSTSEKIYIMLKQNTSISEKNLLENLKKQFLQIEQKIDEFEENFWISRIENNNSSLEYAPESIKKNRKIVKLSLDKTAKNMKYQLDEIKDDDEIVDEIFNKSQIHKVYKHISSRLKAIEEYTLSAVELNPKIYFFITLSKFNII